MTALAMDVRALNEEEIDEVAAAWVANAIGGTLGAIGGAASAMAAGGSGRDILVGAAVGAVGGALSPIRGAAAAANAVRIMHATTVTSAAVGAGTALL